MRNPNSSAVVCEKCGCRTRMNQLTGKLYSHTLYGTTKVCTYSGMVVQAPLEGEKLVIPRLRYQPAPSNYRTPESGGTASVKTVSGGLPGKGKRR